MEIKSNPSLTLLTIVFGLLFFNYFFDNEIIFYVCLFLSGIGVISYKSSVIIENALPDNTMVGDLLYYNDEEEQGSGALGVVEYVEGESINYSFGSLLIAYLDSHRQKIDLSGNNISFTFVK